MSPLGHAPPNTTIWTSTPLARLANRGALNTRGATRGEADERVKLFHESVSFIRECLPKTLFLEESDKPKRYRNGDWLDNALAPLDRPLYPSWPVYRYHSIGINTLDTGVPQNMPRTYIYAI